jgi:hypothetical protein
LEHANLGEDIEIVKLVGLFFDTERVAIGRFCDELAARVFVEYLWANGALV